MANYSVLKAAVAAVVKTNGNQEITGANMQSTLISIINSLGTGYQFMGVATPSTSPGTPDYNVAYIGGAGTYANFGSSVVVPVGSICVFKYNGSWVKEQIALFAGIDDVPTAGSNNLVKSGGVESEINKLVRGIYGIKGHYSASYARLFVPIPNFKANTSYLLKLSNVDLQGNRVLQVRLTNTTDPLSTDYTTIASDVTTDRDVDVIKDIAYNYIRIDGTTNETGFSLDMEMLTTLKYDVDKLKEEAKNGNIIEITGQGNTFVSTVVQLEAGHKYRLTMEEWSLIGVTTNNPIFNVETYPQLTVLIPAIQKSSLYWGQMPQYIEFTTPSDNGMVRISGRVENGKIAHIPYEDITYQHEMPYHLFIPKYGCGTQIISDLNYSYCHLPSINVNKRYIVSTYHCDTRGIGESSNATIAMKVFCKIASWKRDIVISNSRIPDNIGGVNCLMLYNQDCAWIDDNNILCRFGCKLNTEWTMVYKTYNLQTDTLSDINTQKLLINGTSYDFNMTNWVKLLNDVYSLGITYQAVNTNELTGITKNGNTYYSAFSLKIAGESGSQTAQTPTILMTSSDCITWTPIKLLFNTTGSCESYIAVANSKIYGIYRNWSNGTYMWVSDMQGTMLLNPTLVSYSSVRPSIVYDPLFNIVYALYNIPTNAGSFTRSKIQISIVNQSDYSLTDVGQFFSLYGINYAQMAVKNNGELLIVNAEDARGFYESISRDPTTDICIGEFGLTEEQLLSI